MMRIFVALVISCCILTACGVKPGHVTVPEGSTYKFPQQYPDPTEINN